MGDHTKTNDAFNAVKGRPHTGFVEPAGGANGRGSYEVGYCRPPRHTRFKKGQSGNPKGRPRGTISTGRMINRALDETITITENGKSRRIRKREAIVKAMIAKALRGELRTLTHLLQLMQALDPRPEEKDTLTALLDEIARNGKRLGAMNDDPASVDGEQP